MAWLSTYALRKLITLVGTTAGAQTNYQMKLTVYKGAGANSAGVVYLGGRCQDDFDDIRFTKSDGSTELDHWRESYVSGTSAIFWIEFDAIPANPNTATFYIYYDKSDATSGSSGANTFILYEPFDNKNAWTTGNGTWSADGVCHQTDEAAATPWDNGLYLTTPPNNDARKVSVNIKIVSTSGNRYGGIHAKWSSDQNFLRTECRKEATPLIRAWHEIANAGATTAETGYDIGYGAWHRITVGIDPSGNVEIAADHVEKLDFTSANWDKTWTGINLCTHTSLVDFDDLFVANYCEPEPTWGTWGAAEFAVGGGTITPASVLNRLTKIAVGGGVPETETLRPNAAGDETSITWRYPDTGEANWEDVDEADADDGTTYIAGQEGTYSRDLYNLPAHSVGSGTINFSKIYIRCSTTGGSTARIKPSLKSDSTVTDGTAQTPTTSWVTYSQQWNTNPADSEAWEWADVDTLQIGVSLSKEGGGYTPCCTQVYVEVNFTKGGITPVGVLGRLIKVAIGSGSITPVGTLTTIKKIFQAVGQGIITPVGTLSTIKKMFASVGAGTITPVGVLGLKIFKSVGSGTITPVGTVSATLKFFQAVGQGIITPVGTLGRKIFISVGGGTIAIAGALGLKISKAVGSGSITPSGVLGRTIKRLVGEGVITPSGVLSSILTIFQNVGLGTVTIAGTLGRKIFKATGAGSITPSGALGRLVKITVGSGSITPVGVLSATKIFFQSVGQGIITPVGELGRKILLAVGSGTITPSGTLSSILKIFKSVGTGTITPVGTLGRKILLSVGQGIITPVGTLSTIKKMFVNVGQGLITPVGTLSFTPSWILKIVSVLSKALTIEATSTSLLTIVSVLTTGLTIESTYTTYLTITSTLTTGLTIESSMEAH